MDPFEPFFQKKSSHLTRLSVRKLFLLIPDGSPSTLAPTHFSEGQIRRRTPHCHWFLITSQINWCEEHPFVFCNFFHILTLVHHFLQFRVHSLDLVHVSVCHRVLRYGAMVVRMCRVMWRPGQCRLENCERGPGQLIRQPCTFSFTTRALGNCVVSEF